MSELIILTAGGIDCNMGKDVGLLFECAPDSRVFELYKSPFGLAQLIGDFDSTKLKAKLLADKLLKDEPLIRGVSQLRVLEELVIRELQHIFHALNLYQVLNRKGFRKCRFTAASVFGDILARHAHSQSSGLMVDVPGMSHRMGRLQRSWGRLRDDGFHMGAIKRELKQVLRSIDPYQTRSRWRQPQCHPTGQIWFYSTARTFTNIGLFCEPYFPQPFQFLVEDPMTGGGPLRESGRPWSGVYSYAESKMVPGEEELGEARRTICNHLLQVSLEGIEDQARWLFLDGEFFRTFQHRHLPTGMFMRRLFARWIELVKPAALVAGNTVFEGYALLAAREIGIPTILLQHGILGDFCQFVDPPVDHYVVRGKFWRDFLSPPARSKAVIVNPPTESSPHPAKGRTEGEKHILFLTAACHVHAFYDDRDLDEILRTLLEAAVAGNTKLMIRVHPMDSLGNYRKRVSALTAEMTDAPRVTYSQGPGLEQAVADALVAVTYTSTVFLDCLRHQVPIVSFRWHDFPFMQAIKDHGVFHFAADLEELGRLVSRAICEKLPPALAGISCFLDDKPAKTVRADFARLVNMSRRVENGHVTVQNSL